MNLSGILEYAITFRDTYVVTLQNNIFTHLCFVTKFDMPSYLRIYLSLENLFYYKTNLPHELDDCPTEYWGILLGAVILRS